MIDTPNDPALRILLQHLQSLPDGTKPDVEALAREHPEHADAIRAHHANLVAGRSALTSVRAEAGRGHVGHRLRVDVREKLAQGGMSAVHLGYDPVLRRTVAVKILDRSDGGAAALARFLEEAQVSAQLDHPGVIAIHDFGLDPDERPAITMQRVRGDTLRDVLAMARAGERGWNLVRVLVVLQRVCETVAYAHSKGVVHRDIKPSNIMVGRFGEVFVMDWGLALVHGRALVKLRPKDPAVSTHIVSDRKEVRDHTPDSPLVTLDGQVVGTPLYMAPEQARGELGMLGPAADIYAAGAILYEALAGRPPYLRPGQSASPRTILEWVLRGPPEPIAESAASAAPELLAICERATARDPGDRYPTIADMAADLRSYLEGRVVSAHRTGPIAELRMWVRRNRTFALVAASCALLLATALVAFLAERAARGKVERRLLTAQRLHELHERFFALGPIEPAGEGPRRRWLSDAARLRDLEDEARRERDALRRRGEPAGDADAYRLQADEQLGILRINQEAMERRLDEARMKLDGPAPLDVDERRHAEARTRVIPGHLMHLERRIRSLERRRAALEPLLFDDPDLEVEYRDLNRLCLDLEEFFDEESGLVSRVERELGQIRRLRELAAEDSSIWARTIEEIAADPAYRGLRLAPQADLAPLGRNPASGLFEFWHVPSGSRPAVGPEGRVEMTGDSGIVLVLVPPGSFDIGVQRDDPSAPRYVPDAFDLEVGDARVVLDAYLISRHEITQGQWLRLSDRLPSEMLPGYKERGQDVISFAHPVEQVSFDDAKRWLPRFGLDLPTEAQWEYAARAGTDALYAGSDDPRSLAGKANFLEGDTGVDGLESDGYTREAPVDSMEPNAFGLHHMLGNVSEWCREAWLFKLYQARFEGGEGRRVVADSENRVVRGGSYRYWPATLRTTSRDFLAPAGKSFDLGLRVVRRVRP